MECKKIRLQGKLKVITIPAKSDLKEGDYVQILKIKNSQDEKQTA